MAEHTKILIQRLGQFFGKLDLDRWKTEKRESASSKAVARVRSARAPSTPLSQLSPNVLATAISGAKAEVRINADNELIGILILNNTMQTTWLEWKFKEWGLKKGDDYSIWNNEVFIYQGAFKRIGYWAGKGDEDATRLKEKLLDNAVDDITKGRAKKFVKEGELYAKYDIILEDAEKFGFWVMVNNGELVLYKTDNSEKFDAMKQFLINLGLEEGEHFRAKKPESGKRDYIKIKAKGRRRPNSPKTTKRQENLWTT